ncbi:MAG: hypothetical protein HKN44_00695 [Ilumatobacter sp.]|nr:hypothetical protein [Ilumatobacter sp.]
MSPITRVTKARRLFTPTRTAALAGVALLAGAIGAPPIAHAAVEIEQTATIRVEGVWTDMRPVGDGVCDATATVRLRGRMDDGRRVQANGLAMSATTPCSVGTIGDEFRGQGDVDVVGRAGRNGPARVEHATGFMTFGHETGLVYATFGAQPATSQFDGRLRGRVDKASPMGAGVCELSLTAQIDGVTAEGFRLRPTHYTEVEWTVMCSPDLTAGTRVVGTVSGEAIGTDHGRWIDVLSLDFEAILVVDDVTHTGSGSWRASTGT